MSRDLHWIEEDELQEIVWEPVWIRVPCFVRVLSGLTCPVPESTQATEPGPDRSDVGRTVTRNG